MSIYPFHMIVVSSLKKMPNLDVVVPEIESSFLGDLDEVFRFLQKEREGLKEVDTRFQRPQTSPLDFSEGFGDLSLAMQFLTSERRRSQSSSPHLQEQQLSAHQSILPEQNDMQSTTPSALESVHTETAPFAMTTSSEMVTIDNEDENKPAPDMGEKTVANSAPTLVSADAENHCSRKRPKSSSSKQLFSIDDPSSSSAGSASSESDSRSQTTPTEDKQRPTVGPTSTNTRYWSWQSSKALRKMRLMALEEQADLSTLFGLRKTSCVTITAPLSQNTIPRNEAPDVARPRSNYENFWDSETEFSAVAPVDQTDSENATVCLQSRRLLAMRTRDSFLFPKGRTLLAKALEVVPVVSKAPNVPDGPSESAKVSGPARDKAINLKFFVGQESKVISSGPAIKVHLGGSATDSSAGLAAPEKKVFIFVDNSNILLGYYQHHQKWTCSDDKVLKCMQKYEQETLTRQLTTESVLFVISIIACQGNASLSIRCIHKNKSTQRSSPFTKVRLPRLLQFSSATPSGWTSSVGRFGSALSGTRCGTRALLRYHHPSPRSKIYTGGARIPSSPDQDKNLWGLFHIHESCEPCRA